MDSEEYLENQPTKEMVEPAQLETEESETENPLAEKSPVILEPVEESLSLPIEETPVEAIETPSIEPIEAPPAQPEIQTISLILECKDQTQEFALTPNQSVIIGRTPKTGTPEDFFPIDEMDISRQHATITWDGTQLNLTALSDSGLEYLGEELYPPNSRSILSPGVIILYAQEKKRSFTLQFHAPQLEAQTPQIEDDDKTRVFQETPEDDDKTKVFQSSEDVTRFDIPSTHSQPQTPAPIKISLKVLEGSNQGKEETFSFEKSGQEGRIYLGRSEETEFRINETWISRIHASIFREGNQIFLRRESQYDNSVLLEGRHLALGEEVPLHSHGQFSLKASEEKLAVQYSLEGAPLSSTGTSQVENDPGVKLTEFVIESKIQGAKPAHIDVKSNKLRYLLGSSAQCDYRITYQSEYVAPQHAEISFDPQSRLYFVRCVADRAIGMQLNEKSIYDQTPLNDGDQLRLGLDSKAPEFLFRASLSPLEQVREVEQGESIFYGIVELRWEDEEKTREVKLQGVIHSTLARTGVKLLLGNSAAAEFQVSRPGILDKHAQFALVKMDSEQINLKLENLSRDDIEIEDGNSSPHLLPKRNQIELKYQCGRIKLSESLPWLEYNIIPEKVLEGYLSELTSAAVTNRKKLSELIPHPTQGMFYRIGSNPEMEIVVPDVDPDLATLEIMPDDDKFIIRCKNDTKTRLFLEGSELLPGERKKFHFGENLIVGSLDITNDFRVLFPPKESAFLKNILITLVGLFFVLLVASGIYLIFNKNFLNTKELVLKKHQQNVAFVMSTDRNKNQLAKGTGFLWKWNRSIYVITSKKIVQSWKYEPHKEPVERQLERPNKEILDLPLLTFVWLFGDRIAKAEGEPLFDNSFTNNPLGIENTQGKLEVLPFSAAEEYQRIEDIQVLAPGKVSELVAIKLNNFQRSIWKWKFGKAKAGVTCFASLYPNKLTAKNFTPQVIEGTLEESSIKHLLRFVPKEQGYKQLNTTGGVVLDYQGNIMGMLLETQEKEQGIFMLKSQQIQKVIREIK